MTDTQTIMARLIDAHKHSTQGKWQKGKSTHHTVTETGYHIGEFHHADDANFCDVAHELVPALHAAVEAMAAERDEWEKDYKGAIEIASQYKQELEAVKRVIALALKELNTANSCSDMAGEFDFVISKLHEAAGAAQKEPT